MLEVFRKSYYATRNRNFYSECARRFPRLAGVFDEAHKRQLPRECVESCRLKKNAVLLERDWTLGMGIEPEIVVQTARPKWLGKWSLRQIKSSLDSLGEYAAERCYLQFGKSPFVLSVPLITLSKCENISL